MAALADYPGADTSRVGKLLSRLKNKAWRLNHLYLILAENDDGTKSVVQFRPREEQARFFRERHTRNFVPKSRKYGISTAIVLDYLDDCIFAKRDSPHHAAHVDFKEDAAIEKLAMARFAWENGPEHPDEGIRDIWKKLHQVNPLVVDNSGEMKWRNGSKQQAGTSFMGGTPTRLHVSEFGPMAAKQPEKAKEVMQGTINAAPQHAIVDIETTMRGGQLGECYNIFRLASEKQGKMLTTMDWKMFFIPWWKHPLYVLPGAVPEKEETRKYFEEIELTDKIKVSEERQAWYEKCKDTNRTKIYTEFPTVVRECLYAGAGEPFFPVESLLWQKSKIVPLTWEFGDIAIQGDVLDHDQRSAHWVRKARSLSPFKVHEMPLPGESYLIFADSCIGKQARDSDDNNRDSHSYGVLRRARILPETGELRLPQIVAMCRADGDDPSDPDSRTGDRSPTTEMIRRVVALSIYYGDCMVAPEINAKDDIATRMIAAGVKRMWCQEGKGADNAMRGETRTTQVYGWLTNEGSRRQMLDNMQEMTIQQEWVCTFPEILHQMSVFAVNLRGRAEAASGQHDDHVTGTAIGLFLLEKHATKLEGPKVQMLNQYAADWEEMMHDPTGI